MPVDLIILEKLRIKFPSTPKQGIFFHSLLFAKNLARPLSTIVYIELLNYCLFVWHPQIIFKQSWFSVRSKKIMI